MKKLVLLLLTFYQKGISPLLHSLLGLKPGQGCRYSPTCSEYARIHIIQEGVVKGVAKTTMRLLYCHPFAKGLPNYLKD